MIAGRAVGSDERLHLRPRGVSSRGQAPSHGNRTERKQLGLLGENILGTWFQLPTSHINRGAGAFVCGEGSALTAAIEGQPRHAACQAAAYRSSRVSGRSRRSSITSRPLPAFPSSSGAAATGSAPSARKRAPARRPSPLPAASVNTGLIEVPMGTTLREIIFDIGGGIKDGKKFKAVQTGGPAGGCLHGGPARSPRRLRLSRSKQARSWAPAALSSWTRTPAWSRSPASS